MVSFDPKKLTTVSFIEILKDSHYPALKPEDPHLWLNFEADQLLIKQLTGVLADLDPARADSYRKNSQALTEKLRQLDHQYQQS
jgi:zinc transport system substrate-binding protein